MKVGIIGCGFVFDKYMPTWGNHPHLTIAGVTDIDERRVEAVSRHYGLQGYKDSAALLADPDIAIIANFTPIKAHYDVTKAALEAGKHVYSEKPLVTRMDHARELVALAESRGLRLSCAPSNLLGATSQTMWKAVADGAIGEPRLVHAEFDAGPSYLKHADPAQQPGDEPYFPYLHEHSTISPTGASFPWFKEFEMGCTYEHVGYHLSWICAMFGPVKSVTAFSKQIMPDKADAPLDPADTPDYTVAALDFHSGMTGRVTCSITGPGDTSMRIYGNRGMLYAETYGDYKCPVYLEPFARLAIKAKHVKAVRGSAVAQRLLGIQSRRLPLVNTASAGSKRMATSDPWWNVKGWLARRKQAELARQDKCIGIAELAAAVASNRPHFPTHAFTLHMTELTLAIQAAGTQSQTHVLETRFDPVDMPDETRQSGIDYKIFRKPRPHTRGLERLFDRLKG